MRFSRDAVAYVGLLGSQPNLQCKDFDQNQNKASTISAVENLVQQGLASSVKLGDDHHFSGSTSRVPWDEILSDDLLPKVLRTTLPTYLEVVTADGFSILDLSHETAQELVDASTADLGDTIYSIGGVYVKLCIKTAEDWRVLCKLMLADDDCLFKDKAQARMILERIEDYADDKTLCISYFGETHCQSVPARTAGGWPTRMRKKFGVDYTIKIADCRPYDSIMSECLESLLTGFAQEATNINKPNDQPIHLMTSDGTGENAVHTGQRPWQAGNIISGKKS